MCIRIVHTADVHLDTAFTALGAASAFGNRRRQELRDVFHDIMARAADWPADAVLIAGDLYEQSRVTRDTVAFLVSEFEALGDIPVFIAPGNHDPLTPDSPYAVETWPRNVVLFDGPAWTSHELPENRLTVHGFGYDGPDPSTNPFGSLEIPHDDRVHVAVGHGSERACQPPDKTAYASFAAADAAVDGLYYLALGHFHSSTPLKGDYPTTMWYSGAPQGLGFGDTGPRHCLEVTIDGQGVHVEPKVSSRVRYLTDAIDCASFTTTQQVVDAIRQCRGDDLTPPIARVTLTGACAAGVRDALDGVPDAVAQDFDHLDLVDETEPAEDYESLAREPTSLGGFLRQISREIEDAPDPAGRKLLVRAREVGLAAYRDRALGIRGHEGD